MPLRPFLLTCFLAAASGLPAQVYTTVATVAKPVEPVRLPSPGFDARTLSPSGKATTPPLKQVSVKANAITDTDQWFSSNALERPFHNIHVWPYEDEELPTITWSSVKNAPLTAAWCVRGNIFCRYGDSILLVLDSATNKRRYAFDFGAWGMNANHRKEDEWLIRQELQWAVLVDSILYVSHAHRTYAETSGFQNAYITAINVNTNAVVWRSAPLSCNALTFEVWGDLVICGYGFSKEPDFMYALDRQTGGVVQKLPIKSGPDYIIRKGDRLFVRTYNTDYVFAITSDKLKR